MTIGWQTIETAPKDGTAIALWVLNWEGGGEYWAPASWREPHFDGGPGTWQGPWSDGFTRDLPDDCARPTHWMPLPAPPLS